MKHYRTLLSLAFCALLLLLPCRAYAAGYTELTAEIPFAFQNDSSVPHTCSAAIEPVDGAPAPEQSEAQAESGGEGRFVLRFSSPGTFRYRICQTEKDVSGVIYDDRVYTVTVAVRNAEGGGLAWSMWATLNGEEKLGAIAFVNRGQVSGPDPDPSPEPAPSPGKTGQTPQTGDNSRLELYCAMMAASVLTLVFITAAGKHGKKEGDGI